MADPHLSEVIASLAERATQGFRATYVAKQTGRDLRDVQQELVAMVDGGELELQYQLLCPEDGRVISRYGPKDPLPVGETITHEDSHQFVADKSDFWVSYKPTPKLTADLLKEAKRGKPKARSRGLRRRALATLGIDLTERERCGNPTTTPSCTGT